MLNLRKDEIAAVLAMYDLLKEKKDLFAGQERETIENFCSVAETFRKRHEEANARSAEYMKRRRQDPATREKALEIDRRALKKYRSKEKPE